MANSATLLADLIDEWHTPSNRTPEQHRGKGQVSPESMDFWSDHLRAIRWLTEVEDALIAMEAMGESVEHFRSSQPSWYAAVFSQTVPWGTATAGSTTTRRIADRRDVALLRALGQQLDSLKFTPRVDLADLEALRAAVETAYELVVESAIDDAVRRYLLGLIAEVRACLDDLKAFGEVRLREVTFRLGGAMEAAAETAVQPAEKASWKTSAAAILRNLAVSGTAGALGNIASGLLLGPGG